MPAVNLLREVGLSFQMICQDDLKEGDAFKNLTSPTLLSGKKIVFGTKAVGGGCSTPLPTKDKLLRLLKII